MLNLPDNESDIKRGMDRSRGAFGISLRLMSCVAVIGVQLSVVPSVESQGSAPRLQGQVPLADQLSGRARVGYRQHMALVGHNNILNRQQHGNLGWVDDCAYVAAYYGSIKITVEVPR